MDLEFIRQYVERNPYTGGFTVNTELLAASPELRALLRAVWTDGYGAGADDVIADVSWEQSKKSPW